MPTRCCQPYQIRYSTLTPLLCPRLSGKPSNIRQAASLSCRLLIVACCCSGPILTWPGFDSIFPALRFLNASENSFSEEMAPEWGDTGLFRLPPLLTPAGQRIPHIFDMSYTALTGDIPAFLYSENVDDFQAQGIALAVSAAPLVI